MTTINFMPVYQQAPVSLCLLKGDVEAAVTKAKAEGVRVVLPEGEDTLVQAFRDAGVEVATGRTGFGFVYRNDTAVARLFEGEKPIPSDVCGHAVDPVISGEEWLRPDEGTKLVWLEGADEAKPVPARTTVAGLLEAAGADTSDVKAVYVGYPAGDFYKGDAFDAEIDVMSDYVRVYTSKNCMANAVLEICDQYRRETCGHCVYGHEGSYQLDVMFQDICNKKGKRNDFDLVRDLCPVMEDQCLCEVGRTMARTVLEAIDLFGDEIEQHFTKRVCPAGECKAYMTYHVLPDKCDGCDKCRSACDEDAILGEEGYIHVIDQKACTQCGKCLVACPKEAIIVAGVDKPRTPPRPIPIRGGAHAAAPAAGAHAGHRARPTRPRPRPTRRRPPRQQSE